MDTEPQLLHWAVDDGLPPGIQIDGPKPGFVPWAELKKEIEERLFSQTLRVIPKGSTIETAEFHGLANHQIFIVDTDRKVIGSLWFGKDPHKLWRYDGLVRVGQALTDQEHVVWQVYQRYSDGTYRRIAAFDRETRPNRVGFA